MIFIAAKMRVLPQYVDQWPQIVEEFTRSTRAEPGCLWFEWSRSLQDPNEFVLVEAFRDDQAAVDHVGSKHFKQATRSLPDYLQETPKIVNMKIPQDDWSLLGEMTVPERT